jgi:hypothetical protein
MMCYRTVWTVVLEDSNLLQLLFMRKGFGFPILDMDTSQIKLWRGLDY